MYKGSGVNGMQTYQQMGLTTDKLRDVLIQSLRGLDIHIVDNAMKRVRYTTSYSFFFSLFVFFLKVAPSQTEAFSQDADGIEYLRWQRREATRACD